MKILRENWRKESKRSCAYVENISGNMISSVVFFVCLTLGIAVTGITTSAGVLAESVSSNELEEATVETDDEILAAETATIKYSGTDGDLSWTIDTDGHLTISGEGDYGYRWYSSSNGWLAYKEEILTATVKVTGITRTAFMFYQCSNLMSLDVSGFDTSAVTSMYEMFSGCSSLTSLDVSGFRADAVMNMSRMFYGCSSLTSLDVSGFDTSAVTDMHSMFYGCNSLTKLDVSGFDTSAVTDMGYMFGFCSSLTNLDVSGFDTSAVTDMGGMFVRCSSLMSLDVSGFDTSAVTDMGGMFGLCSSLTSLDVSGFDTSAVTDNMREMFYGCSSLISLDVSGFDTSAVTDMENMFYGCSSLKKLNLTGIDTSAVTDMQKMFYGCSSLTSLDISGLDTSAVTDMGYMFYGCSSLTSLDVSSLDTSAVMNMGGMFYGCSSLTSLDVSSLDTSAVTNMGGMFKGCSSLTNLDVSSLDTSAVTSKENMFKGCSSLMSLDISSFKGGMETDMFADCICLVLLKAPRNIKNVIYLPTCEEGDKWYDESVNVCVALTQGIENSKTYTRRKQLTLDNTVMAEIPPFEFTGTPIQPNIAVSCDGKQLQNGEDYIVTYRDNIYVGRATACIVGKGFYVGDLETTYEITPKNLNGNTQITIPAVDNCTGAEIQPEVVVVCDGITLQKGTDYTVLYANNINPGNATVTVIGQGNYTGILQDSFLIKCVLGKSKIDSLEFSYESGKLKTLKTKDRYSLYLDFKPVSYATGYEIELTDRKGKKIKSVTGDCTGKTFIEKKFSKLSLDIYGVRVRCSRDGEYGAWSDKAYVIKQPKAQARNYKGSIQIKWQKLSGVSGYEIYMSTSKNGKFKKVATAGKNTTLKTIKKLDKKKLKKGTYFYYVLAVKKENGKTYKSNINYKFKIRKI